MAHCRHLARAAQIQSEISTIVASSYCETRGAVTRYAAVTETPLTLRSTEGACPCPVLVLGLLQQSECKLKDTSRGRRRDRKRLTCCLLF